MGLDTEVFKSEYDSYDAVHPGRLKFRFGTTSVLEMLRQAVYSNESPNAAFLHFKALTEFRHYYILV